MLLKFSWPIQFAFRKEMMLHNGKFGKFGPRLFNMSSDNLLRILASLYVIHSVMMCFIIDRLTPQDVNMGGSSRDIRYLWWVSLVWPIWSQLILVSLFLFDWLLGQCWINCFISLSIYSILYRPEVFPGLC